MKMGVTVLILLFLLAPNFEFVYAQESNTFYVSPVGDDSNTGTEQMPWKTISYGISQIGPGDTLILRDGTYHESFRLEKSGTQGNPIVIKNYPGEKPIIDTGNSNNGVVISGSHWKLVGLEVRNCTENGIWVENSQFFSISNCTVRDIQYGIGIADGSSDFLIENCLLTDFYLYGFDASASGGDDCHNGLIRNCVAISGSDRDQNVDGFAVGHGDQTGFTFINCTAVDVYDGFDISSDDSLLLGCLSVGCWNAGYKLWGDNITLINCIGYDSNTNLELDWSGSPKVVSIFHSNFIQSDAFNIWIEDHRDTLHLYNSIVAGGDNIGICFENGFIDTYFGDNNLFHNWNPDRMISFAYENEYSIQDLQELGWSGDTGQDENSIIVNTLDGIFTDLDEMILYPSADSPLIDSGASAKRVYIDFDYYQRPIDNPPDIGAYEYSTEYNREKKIDLSIPERQDELTFDEDVPLPFYVKEIILVLAVIAGLGLVLSKKKDIMSL